MKTQTENPLIRACKEAEAALRSFAATSNDPAAHLIAQSPESQALDLADKIGEAIKAATSITSHDSLDAAGAALTLTVREANEAVEEAMDQINGIEDAEELDQLSDVKEMSDMTGTEAQKLLKHEIYLAAYMKSIGRA